MTIRKALFPLLVVFAFLTFLISPAYIVAGLLLFLWLVDVAPRRRWSAVFVRPEVGLLGLQVLFIALSTLFSRDPAARAGTVGRRALY